MSKIVMVYHSRIMKKIGIEEPNFGDEISAPFINWIFKSKGIDKKAIAVGPRTNKNYDVCAAGSILQWADNMTKNRTSKTHVWGSGIISDIHKISNDNFVIHAVRGPKTLEKISNVKKDDVVFGDPGILASRVYNFEKTKSEGIKIGLIPHRIHQRYQIITDLLKDDRFFFIDVRRTADKVAADIVKADVIVSSSLHGLIFSDSYSIPNLWFRLDKKLMGDDFKFLDYFMSIGRRTPEIDVRSYDFSDDSIKRVIQEYQPINELDIIQNKLIDAYPVDVSSEIDGEEDSFITDLFLKEVPDEKYNRMLVFTGVKDLIELAALDLEVVDYLKGIVAQGFVVSDYRDGFTCFVRDVNVRSIVKEDYIDRLVLRMKNVNADDVTSVRDDGIHARFEDTKNICHEKYDREYRVDHNNDVRVHLDKLEFNALYFVVKGQLYQRLLVKRDPVYSLVLIHRQSGFEKKYFDVDGVGDGYFLTTVPYLTMLIDDTYIESWDVYIESDVNGFITRRRLGAPKGSMLVNTDREINCSFFGSKYSFKPYLTAHNGFSFSVKKVIKEEVLKEEVLKEEVLKEEMLKEEVLKKEVLKKELNLSNLNKQIYGRFSGTENFKKYLNQTIPNWDVMDFILKNDNLQYWSDNVLKFSIRFDLESGKKKHLDFYKPTAKRPYKRVYLNHNSQVIRIRYYELGTWQKNYDVFVDEKFLPVYTVEYYNETKERYVDWIVQPGMLYYDKQKFLEAIINNVRECG